MELTVQIPDDLASRLGANTDELSRRALESFSLEEYKSGRITEAELRRLLGMDTRYELDGFLKEHNVLEEVTMDDVRHDLWDLESLGL